MYVEIKIESWVVTHQLNAFRPIKLDPFRANRANRSLSANYNLYY